MLEPQKPALRITRCFTEALSAYASHFPTLLLGLLLAILIGFLSLTFLLGSLFAGFLVMLLHAMEDRHSKLGVLFSPARHFFRFFFIPWFILIGSVGGLVLLGLTIAAADSGDGFRVLNFANPTPLIDALQRKMPLNDLNRILTIMKIRWVIFVPVLAGLAYGAFQGLTLLVKCFYIFILAAHRDLPMLDAFVESRNAVKRYGFCKHLAIIALSWLIIATSVQLSEGTPDRES